MTEREIDIILDVWRVPLEASMRERADALLRFEQDHHDGLARIGVIFPRTSVVSCDVCRIVAFEKAKPGRVIPCLGCGRAMSIEQLHTNPQSETTTEGAPATVVDVEIHESATSMPPEAPVRLSEMKTPWTPLRRNRSRPLDRKD